MPRKYLMTWVPQSRRWSKQYKCRAYAVSVKQLNDLYGPGIPETEVGSYQFANQWWMEKKAERDAEGRPQRSALPFEDVALALLRPAGVESLDDLPPCPDHPGVLMYRSTEGIQKLIQALQEHLFQQVVLEGGKVPDGLQFLPAARQQQVEGALSVLAGGAAAAPDRTVEAHAKAWLSGREIEVQAGGLSPDRYKNDGFRLKHFINFAGPQADIGTINEKVLNDFNQHCKAKIAAQVRGEEGGWSQYTARDIFKTARVFIRWLVEQGTIQPLRNMNSPSHKFRIQQQKIAETSVEQFRAALEVAPERTKLYLLLGVNCAMLPVDMSDLRPGEVDWERGRITRKRSKTKHQTNAPEVEYPLWPLTFSLLQKYRSQDSDRVLLTTGGKPLAPRGTRNDAVARAYETIRRRLPDFAWTPKNVRSFVASLLKTSEGYHGADVVALYLGQAPPTMADRHYARPSQPRFDKAVFWVGEQLGLC